MLLLALMATVNAASQSPTPVKLETSGNFTILAKTGISITGTSSIVGDIGVSPVAATYITGFGLIADPSTAFSTSSLVTGKIYAADYTDPTPAKMTLAIGDMETAYTDAAGRKLPDYSELYTGDLTGKTLAPGLYNWSTGVLVSAAGVTISGTAHDIWIFQVAGNLTLADGAHVYLSNGAQTSNIFWQVAGQATLGTTAAMKGIILCQTAIVMSTGATLEGRALAQTAVSMDANAITRPDIASVVTNGPVAQKSASVQSYRNRTVVFILPSDGRATLRLLNVRGQEVVMVFDGEVKAGTRNHASLAMDGLAKGMYFSKLESNGITDLNTLLVK
jgi:cytoskeletal protein CcmA (bactofilin family)